ncbi:F-box/LRR-repeat protein At4g14103-like [Diospyros lotus]|uniref:F-box/LRR-repeat protein At4g14103-like n=1 Tax=Diospyros lotus TaxID=55363 RepID=UPI0022590879|nr:F-box/LRR-repeat protein At4g14103-like [Diospyros lotus]XP_052178172.1 F-box/LRR-repeat protein At4g14103-like [Diospyros lotus]
MVKGEASVIHEVSTADANEEPTNKKIELESKTDDLDEAVDMISSLPDHIIHHIMSFLPTKDATRSSVLSKSWRYLWGSFPILDFDQSLFGRSCLKSEDFLTYLENSIRRREGFMEIEKFRLRVHDFHSDDSRVDSAIRWALEHGVQELDLYLLEINYLPCSLPKDLCPTKSVVSLKLRSFHVDFQDLLLGFPSLQELVLRQCEGSNKIQRLGVNLKTLVLDQCIGFDNIKMEQCNLQSFIYSSNPFNQSTITLTACIFLKVLSLKGARIVDKWIEHHISELAHLEDLTLDGCLGLKTVTLSHGKLERLSLLECIQVVEIEIDCPQLYSFIYSGQIVNFHYLNSSSYLNATLILSEVQTMGRFVKLRKLLRVFDHCKLLNIVCNSYKDLIIPETHKARFIPPIHDVKHLEVKCHSIIDDCTQLVDNLLWFAPHLQTLSIVSRIKGGTEVDHNVGASNYAIELEEDQHAVKPLYSYKKLDFQFQYMRRITNDEVSFCCLEHPKKCWQHHLKKVMINGLDGFADDDEKSLLKYFSKNGKILELIQKDSKIFRVVQGNYFEQSTILS